MPVIRHDAAGTNRRAGVVGHDATADDAGPFHDRPSVARRSLRRLRGDRNLSQRQDDKGDNHGAVLSTYSNETALK